ncbi:MAG: hypothetical protein GY932_08045 [Arcobacter sp.]|nr:hypothetical protein [Arcobacter sp.]
MHFFTFDHNPHNFQINRSTVHILNQHGKILWTTKQNFNTNKKKSNNWESHNSIYDVDKDGTNEIFLTHEVITKNDSFEYGRIACFNNYGELIWKSILKMKFLIKEKSISIFIIFQ